MTYTPKTKEWFTERIGRRIYRNDDGCDCHNCREMLHVGIIVKDEQHADYLFEIQNEYAIGGLYLNYRDEK